MTSVLATSSRVMTAPKTTTTCSLRGAVHGAPLRPRNTASLLAPSKANTLTAQRRGQVKVQAFAIVPLVARAVTAGVLFYASMNWVYYRGMRKDGEKVMDKFEKNEKSRKSKLDKLSGKATDKDQ
jgi:hypothetical protein